MTSRRWFIAGMLVLFAGCSRAPVPVAGDTDPGESTATIVTSNYPLYYVTTRLLEGIETAPDVVLPTIDGDPTYWTPGPDQVQLLQSSDLIVLNGANAEPWLDLVSLDESRFFDTTARLTERLIPLDDAVQHQHGPEGEHSHQGYAFTTWLDPDLLAGQARALSERLAQYVRGKEGRLRDNLASLETDLSAIDTGLEVAFEPLRGRPVLFSHPVYQYLKRRYAIDGHSLHWEPDEEPSTADWIEFQEIRRDHPAIIMIWEDDPLPSTRDALEASGIAVVTFHTAANRPESGDYLSVMKANQRSIEAATSTSPSEPRQ
jgi:zinc transport system substrate-binding protein